MNLIYNNFKGYWVKAEIVCRGEGILKVSPAPASLIKIFNRAHTGTNSEKAYLIAKLKISCQQSIYMVVISAKYSSISSFQLN